MSERHDSFIIVKVNGKMKVFDREGFDRSWSEVGEGEEMMLTLEDIKRGKTRKQERFFHGPVLKAFQRLGMGKQEAKDMLCLMFIPHDIKMLDGSIVRVPGHTASLPIDVYSDLIESAIQLAAEQGQVVKDADEWLRARRESQKQAVA